MTPQIPDIIRKHANRIIERSYHVGAFTPWHLNTGWCFEIAADVATELKGLGIEHEVLDNHWLVRNGPNEGRPSGVGRMGVHEFLCVEGRYYDAECPDGVDSPYKLPIVIEAVESRDRENRIVAFLRDKNAEGVFPCPDAIRTSLLETWQAFKDCDGTAWEKARGTLQVAIQNLWEPIHVIIGSDDTFALASAVCRVLNSFGIECAVETGTAAAAMMIEGEHSWIRFDEGTILEVALDKTPLIDRSRIGGQVLVLHPDDPRGFDYVPETTTRTIAFAPTR
ncbi:hypothetical protein O9X98_05805 [Agrobacterium salinitolerans]|nr:hypothetical protein [Agrobacterium salinitolerans]